MRILAVEDERIVARALGLQLTNLGYDVPKVASSKHEALALADELRPDLVLMDIRLNGRPEGIDAAKEIRERFDIPVVFLTAHSDPETLGMVKGTDPFGYLLKPAQDRELIAVIEMAVHKHRGEREMRARNRQQAAANGLGIRALGNLDLQSLMAEACTTVHQSLAVDVCEALELLSGRETFLLRAGVGWPDGAVGGAALAVASSGLGSALKSPVPSFLSRLNVEERFFASACDQSAASGVAIAIAVQSETWGVLGAYSCANRDFLQSEVEFLQSVATILGTAIDRRRAEDALESANRALRAEIARRQVAEQQLYHVQKTEALGVLAGGVAHDFNNLLTVIDGYNEMILAAVQPELAEYARAIGAALERAKSLTSQLLAFSRHNARHPEELDLNDAVLQIEKMLRRILREDIKLIAHLGPDLARISIDRGQLDQVIMNLAVNARDAMPDGGSLIIETGAAELTDDFAEHQIGVPAGQYIMLAVSDTGVGIDAETRKHLFEPFFTTKRDKGTGLGLSIVHGIVSQSGGEIAVYSEPAKGTVFKIFFPALGRAAFTDPIAPKAVAFSAPTGTETVLIAEDDAAVRQLACRILRQLGYCVIEAVSPTDAIRLSSQYNSGIDLILTDIMMPEMNGIELVSRLREFRAGMKALFMSGYSDLSSQSGQAITSGQKFIQKPFTAAILGQKVRQVLDDAAERGAISPLTAAGG